MSLALRSGDVGDENGFFIYFDAVTAYTQNYSGSVTKHPIDTGASIVDHFIAENPTITISAVISGVDVSTGSFNIVGTDGQSPQNVRVAPSAVSVVGGDESLISKFIPSSLGQLLPQNDAEVVLEDARVSVIEQVKAALRELVVGTKENPLTGRHDPHISLVTLYEYNHTLLSRSVNNLVITNITFSETVDSGEGLYCDITLEQVKFVGLEREAVPSEYIKSMEAQTAPKESKGKQDSTVKEAEGDGEPTSRLVEAWNAAKSQGALIFPVR